MATKEDIYKKLGTPAASAPSSAKDAVFNKLKAAGTPSVPVDGSFAPPPAPSPWDHMDMNMLTQIGKVLGSSFLNAEGAVAGLPGDLAEFAQPDSKAGGALVPSPFALIGKGIRALGAPTSEEIHKNMTDAGMMNNPEKGSVEDWAQSGLTAGLTAAIPMGGELSLAKTGKSVATQVLPFLAAKAAQDASPTTPGLGIAAALAAAIAQHGVGVGANYLKPATSAARTVAADLPATAIGDLGEYRRLGLPAKAVDVMGPEGVAAVAGVTTRRAGGSRGIVQEIAKRQEDAPMRIKGQINDAANPGGAFATRQQLESNLEAARKAQADAEFPTVREGQSPVNINAFDRRLHAASQSADVNSPSIMEGLQSKYFNRLAKTTEVTAPDGSVHTQIAYTKDPKRIYATLTEMEDDATKNPKFAAQIGELKSELDSTLETAYPHYADIKEKFRKASEKIEALNAGAEAGATTKLPENVALAKAKLGARPSQPGYVPDPAHMAELQQAFRQGHADSTIGRVIHTKEGANATNSLNSAGMNQELTDVYGPDLAKKQKFEQAAANVASKVTPVSNPGILGFLGRIVKNPIALAGGMGALPGVLAHSPLLAGGAAAAGAGGLLQKLLANRQLVKAAGITDSAEFERFLQKAILPNLKNDKLLKSGIIGHISAGR